MALQQALFGHFGMKIQFHHNCLVVMCAVLLACWQRAHYLQMHTQSETPLLVYHPAYVPGSIFVLEVTFGPF